jgi:hypothetical protein
MERLLSWSTVEVDQEKEDRQTEVDLVQMKHSFTVDSLQCLQSIEAFSWARNQLDEEMYVEKIKIMTSILVLQRKD